MSRIYLERRKSNQNMQRFYAMHVVQTIFGEWALIREWGRIGSAGTVREQWFDTEEEAIAAGNRLRVTKEKRGYSELPSHVPSYKESLFSGWPLPK